MKSFSITDVGMKRQVNQDFIYSHDTKIGHLSNLFIVADGMGGHKAGDYASRCCVETMTEQIGISNLRTPVGILEEAINKANEVLVKKSGLEEEYEGMGTTMVAATIMGSNMYVANVGDSRLYLIRNDIRQITEDHSLVEEMVRSGELDKKDARVHPNKNIITRAVGTNRFVIADYFEVPIREGDVILLCSDGLTNMVEDDEILKIIKKYFGNLKEAGECLIEAANQYGGKDNIAVILIGL